MRTSLILLLSLCAWSCLGQLPVVPLQTTPSTGIPGPTSIPGLRYWWVASDLPLNVKVTNWFDRIQGFVLTNTTDSLRPTNSSAGVGFNSSTWLQFSNSFIETINSTGSWFVVAAPTTSSGGFASIIGGADGAGYGLYSGSGGTLRYFGAGGNGTISAFVSGTTYDIGITITNNTGQNSFYTNGVLRTTFTSGAFGGVGGTLYMGRDGPGDAYNGKIKELLYYSNKVSQASITTLHTYFTNTYGFSP